MAQQPVITTTQIGAIGEHIAASQIMLASSGRLSPFLPMADDDGIDLLVRDKITGATLPIQIKSRTAIDRSTRGTVQFDVRLKTLSSDGYLLALLFDWRAASLKRAWLVPMHELESVAIIRHDKLSITPAVKDTSRDRYTPYRCNSMAEVTDKITGEFDRMGRTQLGSFVR